MTQPQLLITNIGACLIACLAIVWFAKERGYEQFIAMISAVVVVIALLPLPKQIDIFLSILLIILVIMGILAINRKGQSSGKRRLLALLWLHKGLILDISVFLTLFGAFSWFLQKQSLEALVILGLAAILNITLYYKSKRINTSLPVVLIGFIAVAGINLSISKYYTQKESLPDTERAEITTEPAAIAISKNPTSTTTPTPPSPTPTSEPTVSVTPFVAVNVKEEEHLNIIPSPLPIPVVTSTANVNSVESQQVRPTPATPPRIKSTLTPETRSKPTATFPPTPVPPTPVPPTPVPPTLEPTREPVTYTFAVTQITEADMSKVEGAERCPRAPAECWNVNVVATNFQLHTVVLRFGTDLPTGPGSDNYYVQVAGQPLLSVGRIGDTLRASVLSHQSESTIIPTGSAPFAVEYGKFYRLTITKT